MQNRNKINKFVELLFISIMLSSFHLGASNRDTVYVSSRYSVHMAFESEIRYVDISDNTPVFPRIIDGYSNLLSLKCSEEFDRLSNLTVMLSSGEIETFILKYRDDNIDLLIDRRKPHTSKFINTDDILSMDKQYFHIGTKRDGVLVLCDIILRYQDRIFFRLELTNENGTEFSFEEATFVVERKDGGHKRATHSSFSPSRINAIGSLSASPYETSRMVLCFDAFQIRQEEQLSVYIHSRDMEDLRFIITAKDLKGSMTKASARKQTYPQSPEE